MARTLLEADGATRAQFVDALVALARPELGDRVLGAGPVALEAVAAGQRQYTASFSCRPCATWCGGAECRRAAAAAARLQYSTTGLACRTMARSFFGGLM